MLLFILMKRIRFLKILSIQMRIVIQMIFEMERLQILNLVEFLVLSISTWNQNFEKNGKNVNVSFIIIVIKIDDSLYAFAKKMKQKWQLISETKRAVLSLSLIQSSIEI